MGGCRCTYRNCTVKSDGKVHLFHYPVFEKLRCHQWLINAHRLDFLNLRVSQLKNRVVCQHHFKHDNFMNYKLDKLRFDAIPTEDGPYCDKSEWKSQSIDISKLCPIIPEDIENDYCAVYDKKANYSMIYGDFLTNSEPIDLNREIHNKNNLNNEKAVINSRKDEINNMILKYEPNCNKNNNTNDIRLQDANKTEVNNLYNIQPDINHSHKTIPSKRKGSPKVKIIAEKKIKEPIRIRGNFKKIAPTVTLAPPKREPVRSLPDSAENNGVKNEITTSSNNISFDKSYVVQVEYDPLYTTRDPLPVSDTLQTEQVASNDANISQNDNKVEMSLPMVTTDIKQVPIMPQSKLLQRKIQLSPERRAAIDSKREFNKMLRNVIQACLDTKDGTEIRNTGAQTNKIKNIKNQLCLQKSYPKKENSMKDTKRRILLKPAEKSRTILRPPANKPNLPVDTDIKDSTLSFLEARMQILENNLIDRIDQNTKKISELKDQFAKGPSKNCQTQTYENEEVYKKFLYQEISKFLSPSCNSAIYEELFINKYSVKEETPQPKTKKRRR